MKTLYIDNARGFKKTAIRMPDVCFLVGENSTGKSTALTLLHFLQNITSSFDVNLDTDDYSLGGFNDIVSLKSTNQTSFTLGVTQKGLDYSRITGDIKESARTYLITFTSNEGLPTPTRFSLTYKNHLISVIIHKDFFFYSITQTPENPDPFSPSLICALAEIHNQSFGDNFQKIEKISPFQKQPRWLFYSLNCLPENALPGSLNRDDFMSSMMPFGPNRTIWIAPIRTKPKRTYDGANAKYSPEGIHTPYILRKHLSGRTPEAKNFKSMIDNIGRTGNLFKTLYIKRFGKKESAPFEIQAVFGQQKHSIAQVGYGVSQVLPVAVESITSHPRSQLFIQQPEVHLHPKAQASLGDMFHSLAIKDDKEFIIETHSDYLIDRYRLAMRQHEGKNPKTSVLFFTRDKDGNHVQELSIDKNGNYPENQPAEFREFFINEQINLLGI